MANPSVKKSIQEKAKSIRDLLGKRCLFCVASLAEEEETDWESSFVPLPICETCYNKYDLIGGLEEEIKEKGQSTRAKNFIELVNKFFANKCFFCERDYDDKTMEVEVILGGERKAPFFNLCQSSCFQRYEIISKWENSLT